MFWLLFQNHRHCNCEAWLEKLCGCSSVFWSQTLPQMSSCKSGIEILVEHPWYNINCVPLDLLSQQLFSHILYSANSYVYVYGCKVAASFWNVLHISCMSRLVTGTDFVFVLWESLFLVLLQNHYAKVDALWVPSSTINKGTQDLGSEIMIVLRMLKFLT